MKERKESFKFKRFDIEQDLCGMKVGTDGVLLGAWTKVRDDEKILDVGCGTGLIALMLAQKNSSLIIKGIDIDRNAVTQAKSNVRNSQFKKQITIEQKDFAEFNMSKPSFDLIVSNPPFFINSLKNPDLRRNMARHADSLPMKRLLTNSHNLLLDEGRLSVIYPSDMIDQFLEISMLPCFDFCVTRLTYILPMPNKPPKRVLIELTKNKRLIDTEGSKINLSEDYLIIEKARHIYTDEYISLTKEYYLVDP